MDVAGGEARRVGGDHEAPDAVVGLRPHDGHVGDPAVRDPHLRPVEDPVVAVAPGAGAHVDRVGAEVGLGQAEAADRVAGGHARQPRLLVLLAAVLPDREHRQRALHGDERAQPAVARLQLTAGHARRRSRSPPRTRSPPGASRTGPARRPRRPAPGGRIPSSNHSPDLRQDPLAHPAAHGVADHPLLVAQERVEIERVGRPQRRHQKSSGRAARAAASASSS